MSDAPVRTPVGEIHLAAWREAAVRIRYLQEVLARLQDPAQGSAIEQDDLQNHGEYLSDAVRSSLNASLDNLHLWASVVSPLVFIEGHEVENPHRPYFTLARAGLESAAQAAWPLIPDSTDERVDRHLRLAFDNLDEMRKAVRHDDSELAKSVGERIEKITAAHPRAIKSAPSYVSMIREIAGGAGWTADDAEILWRTASAAAHGKLWFIGATHSEIIGAQFAPGRFRAVHVPDPEKITDMVTLATKAAQWAVTRYVELIGSDIAALHRQALAAVQANMPRSVRVASAD